MTGWVRRGVWAVAVLGAVVAVGLVLVALLIDLDTADRVASLVGAVVGLASFVVALYALHRSGTAPIRSSVGGTVEAAGFRSVASGGHIGRVLTGDHNVITGPAPSVPPTPAAGAPRSARAAGDRSVAAEESVGEAATGDGNRI